MAPKIVNEGIRLIHSVSIFTGEYSKNLLDDFPRQDGVVVALLALGEWVGASLGEGLPSPAAETKPIPFEDSVGEGG